MRRLNDMPNLASSQLRLIDCQIRDLNRFAAALNDL